MFLFAKPLQEDTITQKVLIYNLPTSFFIHSSTISFYQSSVRQHTVTFTCMDNDSQRDLNSTDFQILLRVGEQLSTRQEMFVFFFTSTVLFLFVITTPIISIPSIILLPSFPIFLQCPPYIKCGGLYIHFLYQK